MGYYNDLTITAKNATAEEFGEIQKAAKELSVIEEFEILDDIEGLPSIRANSKWYDHREFARRLSERFTGMEFQIHRLGEGINEEWDEERYKVKDGEIYGQEVLEVITRWRKLSEYELRAEAEFREITADAKKKLK